MNPNIVIIGRIYQENQPQSGDPTQAAQAWWSQVQGTIQSSPGVDYWEGYNEPGVGDVASMTWLAEFEVARIGLLRTAGFKAAIGSFSTGTPDVTDSTLIQAFYPAIDAALAAGGILGLHEYSSPNMSALYSGSVESGSGWLTGRYRKLYQNYLSPSGRGTLRLAITENGIDAGTCPQTGCSVTAGNGWQAFCSIWGGDCNADYMSQLAWYDEVLRADDYVIGSTVFCLDIDGWQTFDIGPLVPDFVSYLRSQAA